MINAFPKLENCIICVIGLGYVGLPLAIEFARKIEKEKFKNFNRKVIGFDTNKTRINELCKGLDLTGEIKKELLNTMQNLEFTSNANKIIDADVFIITVPTPINEKNAPDFDPLISASNLVGLTLKKRQSKEGKSLPFIIYESTVYPGATQEICIPIIEEISGLTLNKHFFCGYSPERMVPGKSEKKINDIVKITSGSSKESGEWINELYKTIIDAGTFLAKDIMTAEAAKVIENIQRDINIALMNELSIIFKKLNLDTLDVLEAANTKWNFLNFKPGLVGGHCISVDPYYLIHKSKKSGYNPEFLISAREVNDSLPIKIIESINNKLLSQGKSLLNMNVLILGFLLKKIVMILEILE